jgi:hypothetical protein
MLDESLVFHKTALGAGEIGGTGRSLPARLRRALILVDGAKRVADLAPLFRQGEIDTILGELQAAGYISLEGGAAASPAPAAASGAAATAPGVSRFEEARRIAMREVMDRLGPGGDTLALKIERAAGPAELRAVVEETQRVLSSFLGEAAARAFAQKVGRDFGG